jgi:outer membrane protein TolC
MKRVFLPGILLIGVAGAFAQEPTPQPRPTVIVVQPTPSPTPPIFAVPPTALPNDPPPVAPNFQAPLRPLPSSDRVGVDTANQLSLSLEEVIEMALKNNNDIDASRNSVQIAEFNLRGARGIYDPIIEGESYYDSTSIPTASIIGGAVNGSVTQTRFFGSTGVSGFSPFAGGSYAARFDSSRTSTSNTNATLNPRSRSPVL